MKILVQRVNSAEVIIKNKVYNKINKGYCVFLGIKKNDTEKDIEYLINKILKIGLFENKNKKGYFCESIKEINGEILVISQFTLYGDFKKGKKPSFTHAMNSENAQKLYCKFIEKLKEKYSKVKQGKFAAYMEVKLKNDGPATFLLES